MRAYAYRHVVSLEETNVIGNVYYVNHLRWQGRCRELFLRDHAPEILIELTQGLRLITTHCSCEYLDELGAFDEVIVRMRLGALAQSRISLAFDYWRQSPTGEQLVARGSQEIVSMRHDGNRLSTVPVPVALREALRPYEV